MQHTRTYKSVAEMYPLGAVDEAEAGPAASVLRRITAAWDALEKLESSLPGGADRWQADSLFVAREGMRRAWLALANLEQGLRQQNRL